MESVREQKVIQTHPKQVMEFKNENTYPWKIKWYADTTHSSLEFRTKHSGVYDVIGWIQSFMITMEGQKKDFTDVEVEASADIRSVKMPNAGMASNLQGMFDTQNFPTAQFKSKRILNVTNNKYQLIGNMSIKGITRELALEVQFNGFGNPLSFGLPGFTVNGKFNRFDFNIGEPENLQYDESPHPLIGDTIFFKGNLRFYFED